MEEKIVLESEKKYSVELSGEQVVLIINAISKLPYSEVATTIESLKEQLLKQK
jgi:hypothetical protein